MHFCLYGMLTFWSSTFWRPPIYFSINNNWFGILLSSYLVAVGLYFVFLSYPIRHKHNCNRTLILAYSILSFICPITHSVISYLLWHSHVWFKNKRDSISALLTYVIAFYSMLLSFKTIALLSDTVEDTAPVETQHCWRYSVVGPALRLLWNSLCVRVIGWGGEPLRRGCVRPWIRVRDLLDPKTLIPYR